jgi:hypothetical protein
VIIFPVDFIQSKQFSFLQEKNANPKTIYKNTLVFI